MKGIMIPAVLAAVLLLFAGCSKESEEAAAPAEIPSLTLGHVGHDHQIALGVAAMQPDLMQDKCGYHLEELKAREVYNLKRGDDVLAEILVKVVGGGSRMPTAMSQGTIDIGYGGIPAVIFSIDQGNKAKIVSPLNVDGDMLLVRNDFPAKTWEEFVAAVKASDEAVKIGYKAPVAVAKLVFEKGCAAAGITCAAAGSGKAGQVELVNLQGAQNTIPSLSSGSIHGAVINEPVGSMAVHKKVARIVSLLSELPPDGMWKAHPCCCVCATEETIDKHPAVIEGLMKMMKEATDVINGDKAAAAKLAAEWTKKPIEVETMSVPNIVYTVGAGEAYTKGLHRWFDMMKEIDKFQGELKGMSNEDMFDKVHDLTFINKAM